MKQTTLLSFFSKQPSTPSPTAQKTKSTKDVKSIESQSPNVDEPAKKNSSNKLLFVGQDEDDSFVTANDSATNDNSNNNQAEGAHSLTPEPSRDTNKSAGDTDEAINDEDKDTDRKSVV